MSCRKCGFITSEYHVQSISGMRGADKTVRQPEEIEIEEER